MIYVLTGDDSNYLSLYNDVSHRRTLGERDTLDHHLARLFSNSTAGVELCRSLESALHTFRQHNRYPPTITQTFSPSTHPELFI